MGSVPTIQLYEVRLLTYPEGRGEPDSSSSYHMRKDDAKRVARTLCKLWLEDPFRYLVTTEGSGSTIRVYDKDEDEVRAVIFIDEHQYVEVG